jgi:hypothetical protein
MRFVDRRAVHAGERSSVCLLFRLEGTSNNDDLVIDSTVAAARRSFSLLMGRGCVCVFCGSRAVQGASGAAPRAREWGAIKVNEEGPDRELASPSAATRPRTCAATAAGEFSKKNNRRPGQTLGHDSPDRRQRIKISSKSQSEHTPLRPPILRNAWKADRASQKCCLATRSGGALLAQ